MGMKPRLFNKSKTVSLRGWLPRDENTVDKIVGGSLIADNLKGLVEEIVVPDPDDATFPSMKPLRKVKVTVTIAVEEIA